MVIGVCGYGYTGTGAVFSLLKEFENIRCLPGGRDDIEFTISYIPDGLEDLEYHLCTNPSKGVGCDTAIYRFQLLIDNFTRSHNRFTNGKFREISNKYIDSLVQVEYTAFRTFEYDRSTSCLKKYSKLIRNTQKNILKKFGIDRVCFPSRKRYISICPNNFETKTRDYISKIINLENKSQCLLLNQPFSVTNPSNSMRFFEDPYCIIVDRDPRDLYIMAKYVYGTFAKFIPTENVQKFITYYKALRSTNFPSNNRILNIRFEDLIYHYDEALSKIENFLGNKLGNHINKYNFFDPNESIQNTNIYKLYNDSLDIQNIEEQLKEWLYPFNDSDKFKKKSDLSKFTFL